MPCHFNASWLDKKDPNGYNVREWGRKESDSEMFCDVCMKKFSIVKGFCAVSQHSSYKRHIDECRVKLVKSQLRLGVERPVAAELSSSAPTEEPVLGTIKVYSVRSSATVAELIWVMKVIQSNFSFKSCDNLADIFKCMFPLPDAVPVHFSLGATKATYLLTDALAPYFKEQVVKDVSGSYYSLMYDETTNSANSKELDIAVRYWSNSQSQIMTQHLQTYFIGRATAADLAVKLTAALSESGIPKEKMLMLGSDGPNVNKAVFKLVDNDLLSIRNKCLVDLGTCNIHIVHNAFLKGLNEFGEDVSDFVYAVHHFFDGWPSRWEDFEKILAEKGLPILHFLKHVSSRWLTLEPAAQRILDNMVAVTEYFLVFLPKKKPDLAKKASTRKIVEYLKNPALKAELNFVVSSAQLFAHFTGLFQRDEPLVHVLYYHLNDLTRKIMGRICKTDKLKELGVCATTIESGNLRAAADVKCGEQVDAELLKLPEKDRLVFRTRVKAHYVAAAKHILKTSSLKNKPILKNLRCLHPEKRTSTGSDSQIVSLAKALPVDIRIDDLRDEWIVLQTEKDVISGEGVPVDKYWAQFFEMKTDAGDPKYPSVAVVVKAALALSHGNAFVERDFSQSSRTLTDARASMSERTLNAAMTVKCALRLFGNCPHMVPITPQLHTLARCAYSMYSAHLEKEKKKEVEEVRRKEEEENCRKEEEEKLQQMKAEKRTVKEDEAKLLILRKEEREKQDLHNKMLKEATGRLKKASESKNMTEVSMAQLMFEAVKKIATEANVKKNCVERLQISIEKRKSKIISDLSNKKPKTEVLKPRNDKF